MRRWALASGIICACATSSSDDNPDRAELEQTLRLGAFPSPANYPGNGDLAIYEGTSTASGECLIYDILGTQVHAGAGAGAPTVMSIVGNSIVDPATGLAVCTRAGNELYERVHVGANTSGDVLFTVIGRWVFDGELDLSGNIFQVLAQLDDQLLYTFDGPNIYEHSPWDGEILATATKPLTNASKTRKLVIASLIAGECGGLGLYADEDDEDHEEP